MRDLLDDKPLKLRRERVAAPTSARPILLALVLCVLVALLLALGSQGWLDPVRAGLQRVLAPPAQWLTSMRDDVAGWFAGPWGDAALRERVAELERENSRLNEALIRHEQAHVENVFLRQQLAIQRERPWQLLGAEVAVRAPDAGRRVMLLSRGTRDGVQPGMAVIGQNPGGPAGLVGIVETVNSHTAEVLLLTDVGSQISGRVLHEGRATIGLVQGQWQRGSRLRLMQVERAMNLAVDAPVVTAGLTAVLELPFALAAVPANIPIGTIEYFETIEQYQQAELRPFVDTDQVRYVWVILSQDG
ncbi:rod shape-determining protein MreC [Candidatus Viridilinea mediisalina]|uniref:Cell shape-determining protein MreC n=1 Tax=Candidatus Viridilinea mediisalina TaxID=2024553 RepID=A0A2A6RPM2_9CHLR|nr:rod shape-determining protein MreC [Candidatus Viridilinea mediisalina]PDW04875.1 rod shape-determining protein MreC [Candidatus Viridilinea mediisalina]